MGEGKRRREALTAGMVRDVATEVTKRLTDEGKLVEAGWVIFRKLVLPKDAPEDQIREMRIAFFAGAQHVFSSIMNVLDPGEEPTEKDMKRMDHLHNELQRFAADFYARNVTTKGSA